MSMKKSLFPIKRLLLSIGYTAKPLKRIVMTINPTDGPIILYAAVLYQTDSPITDDMSALCRRNCKEINLVRTFELLRKFFLKRKIY